MKNADEILLPSRIIEIFAFFRQGQLIRKDDVVCGHVQIFRLSLEAGREENVMGFSFGQCRHHPTYLGN